MVGLPYLRGFVDVGLPGPLLENMLEGRPLFSISLLYSKDKDEFRCFEGVLR